MKCNQLHPGFELMLPCPFPTMVTITPWALPVAYPGLIIFWFSQRSTKSFESSLWVELSDLSTVMLLILSSFCASLLHSFIILICEISTLALASGLSMNSSGFQDFSEYSDGLSLEFEWQQVSSSLQDSSQCSGHSQQCCSLDGLHSSSNFQVLQ